MKKQKKKKQEPDSEDKSGIYIFIAIAILFTSIVGYICFKGGYKSGITDGEGVMARRMTKNIQIDNFYSGSIHYLIVTSNTGDITTINYSLDSAKVSSINPPFKWEIK